MGGQQCKLTGEMHYLRGRIHGTEDTGGIRSVPKEHCSLHSGLQAGKAGFHHTPVEQRLQPGQHGCMPTTDAHTRYSCGVEKENLMSTGKNRENQGRCPMKIILTSHTMPSGDAPPGEGPLPLVAGIVMAEKTVDAELIQGQPITCDRCGAVLTDPAEVRRDPALGLLFTCSYCGTVHPLKLTPGHLSPVMDFVVPRQEESGAGDSADSLVACVDVSDSMLLSLDTIRALQTGVIPGVRELMTLSARNSLSAVKSSLLSTLRDILLLSPGTRFGLITFGSSVRIYHDPGREALHMEDDTILLSIEAIRNEVAKEGIVLPPLGETAEGMQSLIAGLKTGGATALGPALAAAIAILSSRPRGRIILLTDGMANRGIGSLCHPGPEASRGKRLYGDLAREMAERGIVCDIVGIAGEVSMGLETLITLPLTTGGDIFYASTDELDAALGTLGATDYFGRNARLRIITPSSVTIEDMSGAGAAAVSPGRVSLGQVAEGREVYCRLAGGKETRSGEAIPVQFQLEWTDREGNRRVTVETVHLKAQERPEALPHDFDPLPLTIMEVQKAGQDVMAGGLDASRQRLVKLRELIEKNPGIPVEKAEGARAIIQEELDHIDEVEQWKNSNSYHDYRSVSSVSMGRRSSTSPPPKRRGAPPKLS